MSGLFCKKYSTLCLPSSCGMLVYNEDTSVDASMHSGDSFVVSISFRNSVVSFRYEGRFLTSGCNHRSTN